MATKRDARWIVRIGAMQRLALSLAAALLAFLVESGSVSWHARVVAAWDMGAVTYLGLAWTLVSQSDAKCTRDHVLSQDLSGYLIFLLRRGRLVRLRRRARIRRRPDPRPAFLEPGVAPRCSPSERCCRRGS